MIDSPLLLFVALDLMAVRAEDLILFWELKHIPIVAINGSLLLSLLCTPTIDVIDLEDTPVVIAALYALSSQGIEDFQAIAYPPRLIVYAFFVSIALSIRQPTGTRLLWMLFSPLPLLFVTFLIAPPFLLLGTLWMAFSVALLARLLDRLCVVRFGRLFHTSSVTYPTQCVKKIATCGANGDTSGTPGLSTNSGSSSHTRRPHWASRCCWWTQLTPRKRARVAGTVPRRIATLKPPLCVDSVGSLSTPTITLRSILHRLAVKLPMVAAVRRQLQARPVYRALVLDCEMILHPTIACMALI